MKGMMISLAVVLTMLASGPALGDTTIETTYKTSGVHGMGASEGTTVHRYQGSKSWDSTTTKFTGAVLSRVMGGDETITITRVDKGVYWTLDPKEKTYKETPIEPFKPGEGREQPGQKGERRVRVTKSEFTVKKTGDLETINGFPCTEYLITWLLEMEDVQTREKSRSTMTTNLWTTPETATTRRSQADAANFGRALAKKLGVNMSPREAKDLGVEAMATTFGMSESDVKQGMSKLKSEMSKVHGYPIRTVVNWDLQGAAGGASGGQPGAPTAGGGGCLFGGIPGLSGGTQAGPFFSSITEVKSIKVDSIPASTFEIPAGFVRSGS
jgi:hypothetical protein